MYQVNYLFFALAAGKAKQTEAQQQQEVSDNVHKLHWPSIGHRHLGRQRKVPPQGIGRIGAAFAPAAG